MVVPMTGSCVLRSITEPQRESAKSDILLKKSMTRVRTCRSDMQCKFNFLIKIVPFNLSLSNLLHIIDLFRSLKDRKK